jgi:hypothetical protein
MSDRIALFALCSPRLLDETKKAAKSRGMTLSGIIRESVVRSLGLSADLVAYDGETSRVSRKNKKSLARNGARG